MRAQLIVAGVAASIASSVAMPFSAPHFDLVAVRKRRSVGPSVLTVRTHALVRRQQTATVGNVTLSDDAPGGGAEDAGYSVQVYVGTPPQAVRAVVDTGSPFLVVQTANCTSPACTGLDGFNTSASSTYAVVNSSVVALQYGSGNANGSVASDVTQVGSYAVPNQYFVAATAFSNFNSNPSPNDTPPYTDTNNILGLAYNQTMGSLNQSANFFGNLARNGTLPLPQFGLYLGRASTDAPTNGTTTVASKFTLYNGPSELYLGGNDSSRYTGNFTTIPLAQSNLGYWTLNSTGIAVNGQVVSTGSYRAVIDSGTTFAVLTTDILRTLVEATGAQYDSSTGLLLVECSSASSLPTIGFSLGGTIFNIDPLDLYLNAGGGICVLAVQPQPLTAQDQPRSGDPLIILGDTFMKNWYSVFSGAVGLNVTASVSFATAVHNTTFSS